MSNERSSRASGSAPSSASTNRDAGGRSRASSRRRRPSSGTTTGDYRAARTTGTHPTARGLRVENTRSGSTPEPGGVRSSWTVAILATIAVTGSLIFVAWAKMQTVQYTYAIDALIDEEEELANRQRSLRSELAALRSPANLHSLAPELGLAPPKPGHVVVITGDPDGLNAALMDSEESMESTDGTEGSQ
jgi:cell division protein FtsL